MDFEVYHEKCYEMFDETLKIAWILSLVKTKFAFKILGHIHNFRNKIQTSDKNFCYTSISVLLRPSEMFHIFSRHSAHKIQHLSEFSGNNFSLFISIMQLIVLTENISIVLQFLIYSEYWLTKENPLRAAQIS